MCVRIVLGSFCTSAVQKFQNTGCPRDNLALIINSQFGMLFIIQASLLIAALE